MSVEQYEPNVHTSQQVESYLEILTNFVAGGVAGVGEERQGRLRLVTALARDIGFHLLGIGTADGREVVWVGRVAGGCQLRDRTGPSPVLRGDLPHDRKETGGGLAGRDEAGEGHEGQSESRLLEEHGGQMIEQTRVGLTGDEIAQRIW